MNKKQDYSFEKLFPLYLSWMKFSNYAPLSTKSAAKILSPFIVWCGDRGISEPREVTRSVIASYQQWLFYYRKKDGKPLKKPTQIIRLITICSFFKWLTKKNYIVLNPTTEVVLPRYCKELPKNVLSHAEIEKIINIPDTETPLGIRDRAILETLYSTGIRRMELHNLLVYDIDFIQGLIMVVRGKGGKDRKIPIGNRALAWVDKYVSEVRPNLNKNSNHVFLSHNGNPLSDAVLSNIVRKYIQKTGLKVKGSCHLFRHSMATQMLEKGADIRFIQEMLGHSRLDSTQIYTKVSISKLKEVHTNTHPARLDGIIMPKRGASF